MTIAAVSIMVAMTSITTRKIQPEERAVKKAAQFYTNHVKLHLDTQKAPNQLFNESHRVACGHALFFYYAGQNKYDFEKPAINDAVIPVISELPAE